MASALLHSTGQKKATLEGTTGAVGVQDSTSGHGYNAGSIKCYTGSAPAGADTAESGTTLITITLPNPMFPVSASGVLTANAISTGTVSNTGTVGYVRMLANGDDGTLSTSQRRMQGSAGTSAADFNFSSLSLTSGGTVSVTSLTYTHPA